MSELKIQSFRQTVIKNSTNDQQKASRGKPGLSLFAGSYNKVPVGEVTLSALVAFIQTDPNQSARIFILREALANREFDLGARLKRVLPAVTPAGRFTTARVDGLVEPSGLAVVDLDEVSEPAKVRDRLKDDLHVVAAFVSPSARGVKLFVRVPLVSDLAEYRRVFAAVAAYFEGEGLPVDKSGSDISRLCYLSADPDAWLRPFDQAAALPEAVPAPPPRVTWVGAVPPTASSTAAAANILRRAAERVASAPVGERHRTLLRAARLVGGLLPSGALDAITATGVLVSAAETAGKSQAEAERVVSWGLRVGAEDPLPPPSIPCPCSRWSRLRGWA